MPATGSVQGAGPPISVAARTGGAVGIVVLLTVSLLLLAACGGPAPVPTPTASPVPPTLDIATATITTERAAQPSPAATATAVPPTISAVTSVTSAPSPTPSLTPTATPTPVPERLLVTGSGSPAVNMRSEPGTGSSIVKSVRDGTEVVVVGNDRESDGRIWRNVRDGETVGWIVATALRPLPTPTVTPSSTATPTSTASPTATPTWTAVPTITATSTPTSASTSTVAVTVGTSTLTATPTPGESAPPASAPSQTPTPESQEPTPEPETVEVYGTGGTGANLRVRPGRAGGVLRSVPDGTRLTIVGDDETVDGLAWRHVQTDDGVSGWLAQEVVRTIVVPTPTPRPGAPGIGAPIAGTPPPEEQLTAAELAARPCRPGQVKGDATTGVFYSADHPEYPGLLQRVRCFDDVSRARASGFRPPEAPAPSPSPSPGP